MSRAAIAIYKPEDVRPILTAYHGKDIPIEYGKKEAEMKAQYVEEWKKNGKAKSTGGGFSLSALFGGTPQVSWQLASFLISLISHSFFRKNDSGPIPLTYLEQKRKEAQQHYRDEMEYIRQNKPEFDRLIEEDKKRAEAQMTGNLWSMMQAMAGPPPAGPPPPVPSSGEPTRPSS